MDDLTAFASNVRKYRKARGLSQDDLAQKLNITKQTISAYERATVSDNKGKNPTLRTAIEIAKVLQVSLDALCGTRPITVFESHKTYGDLAREIAYMLTADEFVYGETPATMLRDSTEPGGVENLPLDDLPPLPTIVVKNETLQNFLRQQHTFFGLYRSGQIDKAAYYGWVQGQILLLDKSEVDSLFDIDDYKTVDPDVQEYSMEEDLCSGDNDDINLLSDTPAHGPK